MHARTPPVIHLFVLVLFCMSSNSPFKRKANEQSLNQINNSTMHFNDKRHTEYLFNILTSTYAKGLKNCCEIQNRSSFRKGISIECVTLTTSMIALILIYSFSEHNHQGHKPMKCTTTEIYSKSIS